MYSNIEIFGFRALWSPYFFITLLIITALYIYFTGKGRHKIKDTEPVSTKQKTIFIITMVLLYLAKGSPLDLLGHLMLSAHMTQMAFLYLVIPPLLILGIPNWMIRKVIYAPFLKGIIGFLTKPLIALITFNALFSLYHIPVVFDIIKQDMMMHSIFTTILFLASMMMWFPLIDPLPEKEGMSGIKKIGYIMADGVLLTPACALIIFAETPLYTTYSDMTAWLNALALCVPAGTLAGLDLGGPEMFNMLPLLEDQQLGGIIMKVIQEVMYGSILAYVFFKWARREREKDEVDINDLMQPRYIK